MLSIHLAIISIGLLPILRVCAESHIVYKGKKIECETIDKYVENVSCRLKAINWNKAVAEMVCDMKIPLKNTTVRIEVFKQSYNNRYHPFLIDITVNMCDVFSKRNFQFYGTMFMKILKEYTNVNHSCPISGRLIAHNIYLNEALLPPFPLGFYLISLNITENFAHASVFVGVIRYYMQAMERLNLTRKAKGIQNRNRFF